MINWVKILISVITVLTHSCNSHTLTRCTFGIATSCLLTPPLLSASSSGNNRLRTFKVCDKLPENSTFQNACSTDGRHQNWRLFRVAVTPFEHFQGQRAPQTTTQMCRYLTGHDFCWETTREITRYRQIYEVIWEFLTKADIRWIRFRWCERTCYVQNFFFSDSFQSPFKSFEIKAVFFLSCLQAFVAMVTLFGLCQLSTDLGCFSGTDLSL